VEDHYVVYLLLLKPFYKQLRISTWTPTSRILHIFFFSASKPGLPCCKSCTFHRTVSGLQGGLGNCL